MPDSITVYFDVPAGSPLYGRGFTHYFADDEDSGDTVAQALNDQLDNSIPIPLAEVEVQR